MRLPFTRIHIQIGHALGLPLCSWITLGLIALAAQPASAANGEDISRQQEKIERVEGYIEDHRQKLNRSNEMEKDLIRDLKKIDTLILEESRKYVLLQRQISEQRELIEEQQHRLDKLLEEKKRLKFQVQKRLTAYYQMGDVGFINAVFSASSLPELLHFREMYKYMMKHDRQLFDSFKKKIKDITRISITLEEERRQLEESVSRAVEQQNILADKRRAREKILKKVKTKKVLYRSALAEIEAASRELQMTLRDLEGRRNGRITTGQEGEGAIVDDKKRKPPTKKGLAAQQGQLTPPVNGEVIKKFHNEPETGEKALFSEGINIRTEPGDKIKAVYQGEVIYAGMLPGYGRIIIIDHGHHYVTVVSGVADFIKEVGEKVEQGEVIATASHHSGLLQEGIHFEIRHNTEPLDPLDWLDRSLLAND